MSTNRPPSCDLPPEFYMSSKPNLKPCPICGGVATLWRCETHFVSCEVCEACGDGYDESLPDASTRAINKWNSIPRRSEVAELLRLVEHKLECGPYPINDGKLARLIITLRKEWGLP